MEAAPPIFLILFPTIFVSFLSTLCTFAHAIGYFFGQRLHCRLDETMTFHAVATKCHLDTFAHAASIQRVAIRLRATLKYAGSKGRHQILRGSSSRLEGTLIIDGLPR